MMKNPFNDTCNKYDKMKRSPITLSSLLNMEDCYYILERGAPQYLLQEIGVIVKKSSPKNLSADCQPFVSRLSADSWPTVLIKSVGRQIGLKLAVQFSTKSFLWQQSGKQKFYVKQ